MTSPSFHSVGFLCTAVLRHSVHVIHYCLCAIPCRMTKTNNSIFWTDWHPCLVQSTLLRRVINVYRFLSRLCASVTACLASNVYYFLSNICYPSWRCPIFSTTRQDSKKMPLSISSHKAFVLYLPSLGYTSK